MSEDVDDGGVDSARARGKKVRWSGQDWLIYELAPTETEPTSLVFETELLVRRVKTYPGNWRTLDDAALYALSWTR
jgi:hypothetical protein